MNLPLLRHTIASNAIRLVAIGIGLVLMGVIMPVMYAAFGQEVGQFVESVPLLAQFSNFGGGDLFSLQGTIAMGLSHPFTLLLLAIMAVAFPALAIAGERDRGTLEVTLSRPISRRGLYLTLFVAGASFVALLVAVLIITSGLTIVVVGFGGRIGLGNLAQLWFAASLLFVAFMSLAFAVSVESDRAGPAIGIPAAFMLLNYLGFAIGSIWPDMRWMQDYSMFNLLKAQDVLSKGLALSDVLVMLVFASVFIAIALYRFPRRDLPAPA
ncbi:MAG: ABC transporter permease subunit [Chloroflexota bacterium]|nr:ABC transporter permease subunit [Chloroflexota bacterium]